MTALGVAGIIIGIALLIWLAYKGINVIFLGPICGLIVALFCGMNLLTTFTDVIVPGISNYVLAMFGPILMGCVVAAFYQVSGAAQSIADAILGLWWSESVCNHVYFTSYRAGCF